MPFLRIPLSALMILFNVWINGSAKGVLFFQVCVLFWHLNDDTDINSKLFIDFLKSIKDM